MANATPKDTMPNLTGFKNFDYKVREIFNRVVIPERKHLLRTTLEEDLLKKDDYVTTFFGELQAAYDEEREKMLPEKSKNDLENIEKINHHFESILKLCDKLSRHAIDEISKQPASAAAGAKTLSFPDIERLAEPFKRGLIKSGESEDRAEKQAFYLLGQFLASKPVDPLRQFASVYAAFVTARERLQEQDLPPAKRGHPSGSPSDRVGELFANTYYTLTGKDPVGKDFKEFVRQLKDAIKIPLTAVDSLVKGRSGKDRSEYAKEKIRRFS